MGNEVADRVCAKRVAAWLLFDVPVLIEGDLRICEK
jgi:hypothetical protein